MGASMRYLSQRYAMPYDVGKAVLTDIGTEELAHLEIVAAIVHQLTRNLTMEEVYAPLTNNPSSFCSLWSYRRNLASGGRWGAV